MTDTIEIHNIIRSYIENLCSNKIENIEDIDKFLETFDPPKLNQEDIHNLNRSISSTEIEEAIKNYQPRKVQDQMDSQSNSTRPLKKYWYQYSSKVFQEIEKEGTLPNSFYDASVILISKADKHMSRKGNFRPIYLMNVDAKIFNKILSNHI